MQIITRKRKNKDYFYLQHSFRRGKRVITKEVYLGKSVPKNIDAIMQKMEMQAKKELYLKLEKIKKHFQRQWNKYPESAKEKEEEEIAIAFTYNTNAIEGSAITLEETREIIQDKIAPRKPLNDVKETESHAKVFLAMLDKKENISTELLLRWHREIFGETKTDIAGRLRRYLVRVGDYVAPDWRDVEELMAELITFIDKSKTNPVELAARAHYRFESIHPFGDGNGRIGRLLMNHILWHSGYPVLIIEYKKRRFYYRAFKKGEEGFVNYFLRRYLTVHKKRYQSRR